MNLLRATALSATVLLASCGYSPLYAPGAGAAGAEGRVQVGSVEIARNQYSERNVGQRRIAQTVEKDLRLSFPGTGVDFDVIDVDILESTTTLAVERTAIIRRAEVHLNGTLTLTDENGDRLLSASLSTVAPYNVENTPYSTETSKTYARQTAARNLAAEISRRIYLYYSTHPNTGTSKPAARRVISPTIPSEAPTLAQ